ncbi:MAG: NrdH-redoxin [Deltaproteobacteria bacterium]|nr:NrdH-redoxin [Deltaproteobacteria bacterium]
MNIINKSLLVLLFVPATVFTTSFLTHAAGSSSQTILNPAAPRKSQYPRIVIYTVSWCPHCRELKEYLTSRNIPFINRDVELEPAAMEELVQKYKTYGVPVVIIGSDQEVIKGFTAEQFEKAVAKVRSGNKP